jgi:hypothetical protein
MTFLRIERRCTYAGRDLRPGDVILCDIRADRYTILYDCPRSDDAVLALYDAGAGVLRTPNDGQISLLRAASDVRRDVTASKSPLALVGEG